jgi:hypothetical protein
LEIANYRLNCLINTSIPIFGELVDCLQLSLFTFSITKLSSEFTSGNITTACLFGIVHYKFIAFNYLTVFENSTIWGPLQEDQDRSILPSFDLEERTGQRNAFPKAPSAHQEEPQVSPRYPAVAYKAIIR